MFPKELYLIRLFNIIKEKLTGKKWPKYIDTEDIIYAYKIDPLDPTHNLEFLTNLETKNFDYFVLITRISLTKHGKNTVKDVHIQFIIEPNNKETPEIHIKKVIPNDEIKDIGTIEENQIGGKGFDVSSNAGLNVKEKILSQSELNAKGNLFKKNTKEKIVKIKHPKNIIIRTSSGIGNKATWEFKQGDYEGWNGAYDFNIYFRIPHTEPTNKISLSYSVIPTIIINGQPYYIKTEEKNDYKKPIKLPLILIET